jgi:hypothetical protein
MEGFQAEDRHNPLPHITRSTITLKSAYGNTASLSTRTATELRKLLIRAIGNDRPRNVHLYLRTPSGSREVSYRTKADASQMGQSPDFTRRHWAKPLMG